MAINMSFQGTSVRVPGCYSPPGGFYEYRGFTREMESSREFSATCIYV